MGKNILSRAIRKQPVPFFVKLLLFVFLFLIFDIVWHKGIFRVMVPADFTDLAYTEQQPPANIKLDNKNKFWAKGVNHPALIKNAPATAGGVEIDIYYNAEKDFFDVYHDENTSAGINAEVLLKDIEAAKKGYSIWLDFKNLSKQNCEQSLAKLHQLSQLFQLKNKIIVESSNAAALSKFADAGFYTCYYTPYFNPYLISKDSLAAIAKKISADIYGTHIEALSGYYFQEPALHQYFPNYPILVWGPGETLSLTDFIYKQKVKKDKNISIYLSSFN